MKKSFLAGMTAAIFLAGLVSAVGDEITIVTAKEASSLETLAAREVRRYFYVRTGTMPSISVGGKLSAGSSIVIATKDRALAGEAAEDAATKAAIAALGPQQFILKKIAPKRLLIIGGDEVGTLYGAYRLAERLGVRFYLHADVVPDQKLAAALPDVDETGKPFFDTRGIQPFHDFDEGPDWWDQDDYLAYVSQLAKMRMNFLGLHCYPEGGVGPEPEVWIGPASEMDATGHVTASYPSQWGNTLRNGMWGYAAMKTSEFSSGAARLFEQDVYGPAVMEGMMPTPKTPEQCNQLFNATGEMYRTVFAAARSLGVKTCIGTETPLIIPGSVRERLQKQGKNPADLVVVREVYAGMFQRIARMCPVDYYWLWTPEDWTWSGNKPEQLAATVNDINAALGAIKDSGAPFTLATCGWVLGPQNDRAALDKVLPKNCPMSCINREVGHAPDERGFANVQGRPKWVIPWMENDPELTSPQPWAARMRYDAVDARRLGCTGLLGIHWRTKAMAANVSALAGAAWDQSWVPADFDTSPTKPIDPNWRPLGPKGGNLAAFSAPVAGTDEPAIYQTVRYNMDDYSLEVPNGTYTVTLKFNEPNYGEAGKRVFGVKLQGKQVIQGLDMFAKAGKNKAIDYTYENVAVTDGRLNIDFTREVEFPCIAGIVVTDGKFTRKINCGGPKVGEYEADDTQAPGQPDLRHRAMPIEDFYVDLARASFGESVAKEAGHILAGADGEPFPKPATWGTGPGNVKVEKLTEAQLKERYAFVERLSALRSQVTGAGNLERFDYWLNTYRQMAAMADAGRLRAQLDEMVKAMADEKDAAKKKELAGKALPVRIELARAWERMITCALGTVDTPGELGTIANLEQQSRRTDHLVDGHDQELIAALGEALPAAAQLSSAYAGPARITVPTVRTQIAKGETLRLKAIILDNQPAKSATLLWRPLGRGKFQKLELANTGRGVYRVTLPAAQDDFEYYLQAEIADGKKLSWPAAAPAVNQTVIVTEPAAK